MVVKANDLPHWQAKKDKAALRSNRKALFKNKKFEQLNANQKDKLLKAIATQLGLLEDSED